nr:Protein of unknown function DUF1759 domain containing protein [Haemonchus contortus]
MEVEKVEDALLKYSSKVDELPAETLSREEILKRAGANIDTAQEILDRAEGALRKLLQLKEELEDQAQSRTSASEIAEMKLTPIPLPRFSGDIWEWETFWNSFTHNVHSGNVNDIYKFNFLLEALDGEAKEAVKQFQVCGSTYSLVISHLHEKYGNTQALVDQLVNRLEASRARSDSLADQLAAYIASNSESHLVVGKSKLPSIRENPTLPKLELNALSMATRLAYTSYEAMKERLTIRK